MVGGVEHQQFRLMALRRGEAQYPVREVGGGQAIGFFRRAARVFRLDGEIPQVPGGLHQGTARKGAACPAGGEHQFPSYGFCVQVAGTIYQHPAHAAVQAAGVGAEVRQQVIVPVVHAALVQRNGEQDALVFQ